MSLKTYREKKILASKEIYTNFLLTQTQILSLKKKCGPKDEKQNVASHSYLETWQSLVIKCKNGTMRFLDNLDTVVPEIDDTMKEVSLLDEEKKEIN